MHEDNMKKLQGDCVSWLVLLTGAAQLLLVCGEGMFMTSATIIMLPCLIIACMHAGVYLSLGSTNITTNNTEILITDIGEDAEGGLPSLTCHTDLTQCCSGHPDNNGNAGLGQWTYPNGSLILNNGGSTTAEEYFYFMRNAPQTIRLAHRRSINPPPLSPTGSYCCTIPTTGGEMTLCVNLGEWFCNYSLGFHSQSPSSCVPVSPYSDQWKSLIQRPNTESGHCGQLHLWHWLHSP